MPPSYPPPPSDELRHKRILDALAEVAQLLAGPKSGTDALSALVATLERVTGARIRLVLHEGAGLVLDAHGSHRETCVDDGACEGALGGKCPVVHLRAPSIQDARPPDAVGCRRRLPTPAPGSLTGGRVCVPLVATGEVIGSLTAETLRASAELLRDLERFLSIVAPMVATEASHRAALERERSRLSEENLRLRDALGERLGPENIIGQSRPMRDLYARLAQVANSDTTVLVRGESGTGKELVASALHYASARAKRPFVRVNVAALGESLLESELFGHEKGAFTGALKARIGRLEEAQGGTLFLDEIGDFSPVAQVKLLRVLQERQFERVGSNRTVQADVRIIAATNRNLEEAVADGSFRHDLYYRINVFPVQIPALRARSSDILLLADHFAVKFAAKMGKSIDRISSPAIDALMAYHWPGNVRELENAIEHAVLLATDDVIFEHNLPATLQLPRATNLPQATLAQRVSALERDLIQDALKRTGGNVAAAARELGLTARVTRYKIQSLELHLPPSEDS